MLCVSFWPLLSKTFKYIGDIFNGLRHEACMISQHTEGGWPDVVFSYVVLPAQKQTKCILHK